MAKKVSIIGAGLAGLSTGIYLQRAGVETQIFELAPWAGGMCTAWKRKGYRFDGCIQSMVGTKKDEPTYKLYKEVGALRDDTVIYNTDFISIESSGVLYKVPLEPGKFREFLCSVSNKDASVIDEFCKDLNRMIQTGLVIGLPSGFTEIFMMLKKGCGFISLIRKYTGKTVAEVEKNFKSDIIRNIITMLMPRNYSALALFLMLGTRMGGNAGYPMGGASDIIESMTERYKSVGGKMCLNARVDEIIVLSGKAKGVRTEGLRYECDGVVAACDAYDTLEKMLRGRYTHPQINALLKKAALFDPLAVISFGLDKKFNIPFSVAYECHEGIETAPGINVYGYRLRSFECDPASAPAGGSSVMAMLNAPLGYWAKLRGDNPDAYKLQKELLAERIASKIDVHYPGFKDAIAVVNVATPATYVRLTNVYKGSFKGFAPTPDALKVKIKKTIPGLKCFCMCGQWTMAGGGIAAAINDGKKAAKIIKKAIF